MGLPGTGGQCAPWDVACKLKNDWVKYAVGGVLIVGGVIVLSSFAKGLGQGVGRR